jgi:hypothetical protein
MSINTGILMFEMDGLTRTHPGLLMRSGVSA